LRIHVAAVLLACCGCGAINSLRGHNIAMTKDAFQDVASVAKRGIQQRLDAGVLSKELASAELARLQFDIDDGTYRLDILGKDFRRPKDDGEPVERSTPENRIPEDEYRRDAYAGLVAEKMDRKRRWDNLVKPLLQTYNYIRWILDYYPILIGVAILVWGAWNFRKRDEVMVRTIGVAVQDKEQRRQIAEGTPVGRTFERMKKRVKRFFGWSPKPPKPPKAPKAPTYTSAK